MLQDFFVCVIQENLYEANVNLSLLDFSLKEV